VGRGGCRLAGFDLEGQTLVVSWQGHRLHTRARSSLSYRRERVGGGTSSGCRGLLREKDMRRSPPCEGGNLDNVTYIGT
jgi:hypothetical protein